METGREASGLAAGHEVPGQVAVQGAEQEVGQEVGVEAGARLRYEGPDMGMPVLIDGAALTGREAVVVESAAGGVGGYLVQLASQFGARRVIATAGSAAKRETALALGADAVLDHRAPDWADQVRGCNEGAPVDVVFESIGGASAGQLLDALVPGSGRMLFYGLLSGEPPAITPMDLLRHGVGLIGCGGRPVDYSTGRATGWSAKVEAGRPEILHRAATGGVRPLIDSTFPLADAAKAHQRLEQRQAAGKVILLPAVGSHRGCRAGG
jgi:NADPH:quinone reductase-like Zn-dependent oxidoreductase